MPTRDDYFLEHPLKDKRGNRSRKPPIISSVSISGIKAYTATVTWTTNLPCTSQVFYGINVYTDQSTTLDSTLGTSHSVNLSNLTAQQFYFLRVTSRLSTGELAVSDIVGFTTRSPQPDDISGLQFWYKADADTYQDTGFTVPATAESDPVLGWKDQSGNGRHLTQVVNNLTYRLNQLNGLPSCQSPAFANALKTGAFTFNAPITIVAVLSLGGGPLSVRLPVCNAAYNHRSGLTHSTGSNAPGIEDDSDVGIENPALSAGNYIVHGVADGSSSEFWLNNATQTTGTLGTTTLNGISVAGYVPGGPGNIFWRGHLYEIVGYNNHMSDANRTILFNYLNTRWAVV